jgi:hypothetical protein
MDGKGKTLSIGRVTDAFDTQLMDRLNASRKFRVTAVSDLATLLKATNRTGQSAEAKTLAYGLVATLDDFEDSTARMEFKAMNQVGIRRTIRLSVVAKIYNLTLDPPELFETANIQVTKQDARTEASDLQKDAESSDELLIASVREASQKISDRVADVVFPAKIIARTGRQVTINRGDGSGIAAGQVWNIFAPGKTLKDPDTGEVLGREELLAGSVRILSVQPKFCTAEVVEAGALVTEGMILRPAEASR